MDIIILGQILLGFLAVVAIIVTILLLRLGRRYRGLQISLTPLANFFLRWLPFVALVVVASGVTLGETSLLSYHEAQDVSELNWFVVGACLAIFADLCAAMTWITLREAVKGTDAL
jgi:hypothetical protein